MKKIYYGLILVFVFSMTYSQDIPVGEQLLRTTGFAVHAAHKAVLANGVYTGDMAKSIEHQRYAVRQYKHGDKKTAFYHSAYARKLAFSAINANRSNVNPAFEFTEEEKALIKDSPADEELDKVFNRPMKDENYLDKTPFAIDL